MGYALQDTITAKEDRRRGLQGKRHAKVLIPSIRTATGCDVVAAAGKKTLGRVS